MNEVSDERRVLELAERALEHPPSTRQAWLEGVAPARLVDRIQALCRSVDDMTADTELPLGAALSSPSIDRSGDRVGAYRLLEVIGEGATGQVYLALAPAASGPVALKLLRSERLGPGARAQLEREQRILAQLVHPNIARLLDAGVSEEDHPYVVMELVDGPHLDVHARSLALEQILRLFVSVCAAVVYAHRARVIHRDLKPSNILVTRAGQPKLLDFGIAKSLAETSSATLTAAKLHTPAYASPEQLQGEPLDEATDIYSLGVILYQLVTGTLPFDTHGGPLRFARTVLTHTPELPSRRARAAGRMEVPGPELDRIILGMLEKAKDARPPSVEAVVSELRAHLSR